MTLGFIGLGAMGLPIVKRLMTKYDRVLVYDVVQDAVKKAVDAGAKSCDTVTEMAQKAELIFCSLPNADIIGGILKDVLTVEKPSVKTIVDLSSVAPTSSREFATWCSTKKITYVDSPVSGGVGGAAAGTLTLMMGCDDKTFEYLAPMLDVIGKKIYHVGACGAGSSIKMINNYIMGCNMAAAAEAFVLGAMLDIDAATIQEIVGNSSGRSFIIENKLPNYIMKRAFDGGFAVDLEYKDLGLSVETAKRLKMPILMGSTAVQVFEMARAKGFGRQDISSVVKVWEDVMGKQVE